MRSKEIVSSDISLSQLLSLGRLNEWPFEYCALPFLFHTVSRWWSGSLRFLTEHSWLISGIVSCPLISILCQSCLLHCRVWLLLVPKYVRILIGCSLHLSCQRSVRKYPISWPSLTYAIRGLFRLGIQDCRFEGIVHSDYLSRLTALVLDVMG